MWGKSRGGEGTVVRKEADAAQIWSQALVWAGTSTHLLVPTGNRSRVFNMCVCVCVWFLFSDSRDNRKTCLWLTEAYLLLFSNGLNMQTLSAVTVKSLINEVNNNGRHFWSSRYSPALIGWAEQTVRGIYDCDWRIPVVILICLAEAIPAHVVTNMKHTYRKLSYQNSAKSCAVTIIQQNYTHKGYFFNRISGLWSWNGLQCVFLVVLFSSLLWFRNNQNCCYIEVKRTLPWKQMIISFSWVD